MPTMREVLLTHKLRILSYNPGSKSANALRDYWQQYSKKKIFIVTNEKYQDAHDKILYNWGSSSSPRLLRGKNLAGVPDNYVRHYANKISFFREFSDCGAVNNTTDAAVAQGWLASGRTVVARHSVTAHSGLGMQIIGPSGELYCAEDVRNRSWLQAKLLTEYFAKSHEYRVFVLDNRAVLVRRKRKANDAEEAGGYSKYVRVHSTGWNFCAVDSADVPQIVVDTAVHAYRKVGTHGLVAFDVGYKQTTNEAALFEGNTAPGLEGETVKIIGDAILDAELRQYSVV